MDGEICLYISGLETTVFVLSQKKKKKALMTVMVFPLTCCGFGQKPKSKKRNLAAELVADHLLQAAGRLPLHSGGPVSFEGGVKTKTLNSQLTGKEEKCSFPSSFPRQCGRRCWRSMSRWVQLQAATNVRWGFNAAALTFQFGVRLNYVFSFI